MLRYMDKLSFICLFSFFYAGMSLFHCAFGNQSYQCLATLDLDDDSGDEKYVGSMVSLSDERVALVYGYRTVKVLDLSRLDCEPSVTTLDQFPEDIVISSLTPLKEQRLASGYSDGTITVWDLNKSGEEQCVAKLEGHTGWVRAVEQLFDGRLASISEDGTLKVWDLSRPRGAQCVATLNNHVEGVGAFAQLSDGRLVSASTDGSHNVWNLSEPGQARCVVTFNNEKKSNLLGLFLVPLTNGRIVSCQYGNVANVWDLNTLQPGEPVVKLIVSKSKLLRKLIRLADDRLVSCAFEGVKVWDLNKPEESQCVILESERAGFGSSVIQMPNGWLASSTNDKTIKLWNLDKPDGQQRIGILQHNSSIGLLAALSYNRLFFISREGIVKVWDLNQPVDLDLNESVDLDLNESVYPNPPGRCILF